LTNDTAESGLAYLLYYGAKEVMRALKRKVLSHLLLKKRANGLLTDTEAEDAFAVAPHMQAIVLLIDNDGKVALHLHLVSMQRSFWVTKKQNFYRSCMGHPGKRPID
jgi:hypothetical protein